MSAQSTAEEKRKTGHNSGSDFGHDSGTRWRPFSGTIPGLRARHDSGPTTYICRGRGGRTGAAARDLARPILPGLSRHLGTPDRSLRALLTYQKKFAAISQAKAAADQMQRREDA